MNHTPQLRIESPTHRQRRPQNGLRCGLAPLACICALIPIGLSPVPPMSDYPNHLARAYIAQHIDTDATLAMYTVQWRFVPNIGFDVAMWLFQSMGLDVYGGPIGFAITLVALITGAMVLHRALYRHWALAPLSVGLFAYHACFLYGFTSFSLGVGLTLWALVGWVMAARKPQWIRLPLFVLLATLLYGCHLFAVGLFGLVVVSMASHRLSRCFPSRSASKCHLGVGASHRGQSTARHSPFRNATAGNDLVFGLTVANVVWGLRMPISS